MQQDIRTDWVHIQYQETGSFNDVYGFSGSQGAINLEGLLLRPAAQETNGAPKTLLVFMHPASTLQLLPLPRALAAGGAHVLCAASRYAKNDTALILEKVVLDLGAYIRHAKTALGYEHVVIVGWSGGGSLALMYQAQAENPSITHTPAGDPVDVAGAKLLPADAIIFQAAHLSRGHLLAESIDPSVRNELVPEERDMALDIYNPLNPAQPPYSAEFMTGYRAAQLARMRRITTWAKDKLAELKARNTGEMERGFIVHRTQADPRFMDPALDPNGRKPRWCYMGNPETVNSGPVGLARFTTLRAWLSQWSLEDSNGNGLVNAARFKAPLLVIENGADDGVPATHPKMLFDAAASPDKTFRLIEGAGHYYAGQPQQLAQAQSIMTQWLGDRGIPFA